MRIYVFFALLLPLVFAGLPIPRTPDGFSLGDPNAQVTFELFGDTMCPDTKFAYPIVRQVVASYGPEKMRFVFHALSLPYTHNSMLTNQGIWVVANRNSSNVFKYIEAIFANQDSFWNRVTADLTTNEVIAAIAKVALQANTIESVSDFITGMADEDIYYAAVGSWKYIVSRAVTDTPTFFVNNIRVEADFTWTVEDWKSVLDPLFGSNSQITPKLAECPAGLTECDYAPGKSMCCPPSEQCVPNVGCRCAEDQASSKCDRNRQPFVYSMNQTCPAGQQVCNYFPDKFMCCLDGEQCVPNVGCRCALKDERCFPRTPSTMPIYTTKLASCPAGLKECDYLPGQYMCCPPSEQCVPNVGCRCAKESKKEASPKCDRDRQSIVYSMSQTCPPGQQVCNYSPDKYMCCLDGEQCIPNVGCMCALKNRRCAPRRASSVPIYTTKLTSCPAGLMECDYLPGQYMCCPPSEHCVPNVGCRCAEGRGSAARPRSFASLA